MPVCFSLTRKGETEPTSLYQLDSELRDKLGYPQEPDEAGWLGGWYDRIGFRLALGNSWEEIEKDFREVDEKYKDGGLDTLFKVLAYLKDNFTADNWREVGKWR